MEIIDNNKVVIDIYKYDELVSQLTRLMNELEQVKKERDNYRNLLEENLKINEMLKDIIKGGNYESKN